VTLRPIDPSSSTFYNASIATFLAACPAEILGRLVLANDHDLEAEQKRAWEDEIRILQVSLAGFEGTLYLEFEVPRLGSRVDAVVISGPAIFPIEFKCGERVYHRADIEQVWDYALDLKNFHQASHHAPILPVLLATDAPSSDDTWAPPHADDVRPPLRCNASALGPVLRHGLALVSGAGTEIDGQTWGKAPYHPTPTIIEAARALYARHSVEAISRHDAGATNLRLTSVGVEEIIERARAELQKAIVFVTGVPGAGKTLVGLNVATRRRELGEARAVFLSGNGPLVSVLQEALTRDELARTGNKERKGAIRQKVKPFIQNVHHFRDEGVRRPDEAPFDHVVIFDEAQRAWNREKTSDFMKRRKKIQDFHQSEPEFLISYLDRHAEWAVIICLVGGGQEIHTGEAGIAAWLDAVRMAFPNWRIHVSPDLADSEYAAGHALDAFRGDSRIAVVQDPRLHLASSMRSFRSEKVSAFVKAVLDCDVKKARILLEDVSRRYPIAVTRDLARAKQWIREQARGSERYGLVASSQAQRLKPHAIDVRVSVDPIHWFLDDRHDTRSSYYLEDAATEFQVQGLELDWICVTWDADLRLEAPHTWRQHSFRGDSWQHIRKAERKQYLLNAYRVLLTRARQGMVIFVPPGDEADPTRHPKFYDPTFEYLRGLGMEAI
jgi:Schlafen group 3, DNA/RNA helicase domain